MVLFEIIVKNMLLDEIFPIIIEVYHVTVFDKTRVLVKYTKIFYWALYILMCYTRNIS